MDQYILALDQGTTSSRAILFDHDMNIAQISQREFGQSFPKPGWVEHNPDEIFESQTRVAVDCLAAAGVDAAAVAAVGIANQRETTVVWDKDSGNPVYPAIVWQDRRTAAWCDTLREHSDLIRAKTGLMPDAYFSGTKLRWILENVPDARQKAARGQLLFGTIDTWLAWSFSKGEVHVTDPSNASRTMLFNLDSQTWDEELLDLLDIPAAMLPAIVPSSGLCGQIHPEFLGRALPLAGLIGDQQSATFGNACLEPGMLKNTYGTGCFLLLNTGAAAPRSTHNLLGTVAWSLGGSVSYALEGSIFMGGAIVQWLRDGLGLIRDSSEIESLALSVPDSGGVFLVPAFAGLGAPWWDQYARGTIVGLTRGSGKGQIARAALEAIALQSLDIVDSMSADMNLRPNALRVDGGAARNNLLMQFQADMLGIRVERPRITETTALGAACLAGLGVGFWRDQEEMARHWRLDRRFEPKMSEDERRNKQAEWHKAVQRSRGWAKD